MPVQVKHSGTWKTPTAISAKDAGTWKAATVFAKENGVWKQAFPVPATGFDPATLRFWFEYNTAKTGYVTTTGGDGNLYLVSAPNLGVGSAGTLVGLTSGASSGDHALATPIGWRLDDAGKGLRIQTAERSLVTSMGAADTSGTGAFHVVLCFTDGGSSNNNTQNGSGSSFTVTKYETVTGTDRLKVTDGFNTLANGTGTATADAIFNFSPQPVSGNKIFMLYQRDPAGQKFDFTFGLLSQEYSAIQKTNSQLLATPLFLTSPRNNTLQNVSFFFNETTTLHAIGRGNGLLTESQIEGLFNYLKPKFA